MGQSDPELSAQPLPLYALRLLLDLSRPERYSPVAGFFVAAG